MKAVGSYIIIKDEEVIQKNDLGLIITEESDTNIRYIIGEVVSVGSEVKEVEVGGRVYFDKIAGSNLRVNGQKLKAIRERDVVVILGNADSII
jgi:co-chaperonin GroES (HSP10)|tara:strand:+ start:1635 stop:1913 length:279 start_codon:yes stop_codon:yes gene_type:complete